MIECRPEAFDPLKRSRDANFDEICGRMIFWFEIGEKIGFIDSILSVLHLIIEFNPF